MIINERDRWRTPPSAIAQYAPLGSAEEKQPIRMKSWFLGQRRIKELLIKAGEAFVLSSSSAVLPIQKWTRGGNLRLMFGDVIKDFTDSAAPLFRMTRLFWDKKKQHVGRFNKD